MVGHSQLTVMSTVWTSVPMSLTAVHWYVPALCLLIDGISRYSSSDAMSPAKGHEYTRQKKERKTKKKFRDGHLGLATESLLATALISSATLLLWSSRNKHVDWCQFLLWWWGVFHLPTRMFALEMQRAQRQRFYFGCWQKTQRGECLGGSEMKRFPEQQAPRRSLLSLARRTHPARQREIFCVKAKRRNP